MCVCFFLISVFPHFLHYWTIKRIYTIETSLSQVQYTIHIGKSAALQLAHWTNMLRRKVQAKMNAGGKNSEQPELWHFLGNNKDAFFGFEFQKDRVHHQKSIEDAYIPLEVNLGNSRLSFAKRGMNFFPICNLICLCSTLCKCCSITVFKPL